MSVCTPSLLTLGKRAYNKEYWFFVALNRIIQPLTYFIG